METHVCITCGKTEAEHDGGFPCGVRQPPKGGSSTAPVKKDPAGIFRPRQEVVGHCPRCGAPVYGPKTVATDEPIPVRHSCSCNHGGGLQVQTK